MPDNLRTAAGALLAKKIQDNDTRMSTGFLGTRPLLPVLSATGQSDLAVRLLQSRKYPSWGYEVEQGATTIWERWNSYTKDNGFGGAQNAQMNSFAHYAFGAVCEWMFSQLAGIQTDGPGYKRIIIRPTIPSPKSNPDQKPIDWVRALLRFHPRPHRQLLEGRGWASQPGRDYPGEHDRDRLHPRARCCERDGKREAAGAGARRQVPSQGRGPGGAGGGVRQLSVRCAGGQ